MNWHYALVGALKTNNGPKSAGHKMENRRNYFVGLSFLFDRKS